MESLLNLARVEFPSLPHWLLLAWVGVEPQCFPVGVAGIEQLLSKSFLSCQAPLSWTFGSKSFSRGFFGGLCLLAFLVAVFSNTQSEIHEAK